MEKITELTSEDIVKQNIERLKEIFPTAFSEGKLVVDELQALVGEYIQKDKEFYQMTWAGKTEAQREANKVSTGTLRPSKEESKDWDTTGNIFIEGDNLEVLKLLQKSYSNKIKMIYIDPPYNTGKDFVYKDNYKDNLSNYLELTGQTDEVGKKLSTNTDSDGRYHSNWLNMMYPRLKLARNLMTDDGVIFISIDDNEQANLKKLCDEIFGEENFIENYFWENTFRPDNSSSLYRKNGEFIVCYSKNFLKIESLNGHLKGSDGLPSLTKNSMNKSVLTFDVGQATFQFEDGIYLAEEKGSGYHLLDDVTVENGKNINKFRLEGRVIWGQDYLERELSKGTEIIFKSDGFVPYSKKIETKNLAPNKIIPNEIVSDILDGRSEINKLFGKTVFSYPKPTSLLKYLIGFKENDLILDFFAGSSTTADAIFQYNLKLQDEFKVKFILVQLPENLDLALKYSDSVGKAVTQNAIDYLDSVNKKHNLTQISKERIRLAGELIKKENKDKEGIENLDTGFRVFKLDSSNINAWDTSVDEFEGQLELYAENNGDHIKTNRTEEDVLFEILLKYGLELTLPIQEKQIGAIKIYNIGFGSMYICLSDHITIEIAKTIGEWHKESSDANPAVIFKDSGFASDADKTNTIQMLRQAGIENVKSI